MNTLILNREFQHPADGFYHIEAKGFHPLTDGRKIVQVIDDAAIAAVVNRFTADVSKQELRHGSEMLIDHEHFKHDPDKATTAYGWAQEVQARADGIYARNRWTGTGKPAVDGGDYRFFSTEYDPAEMEEVKPGDLPEKIRNQWKGWKFLRPLRLDGLTLTNMHNNRGQRPITNRDTLPVDPANSPTGAQVDIQKIHMKQIATKLGLSADASEEAILGELTNRLTSITSLTVERDKLTNRVTVLQTANDTLLDEQIAADLASHHLTDEKIINRLSPILKGMEKREDRLSFITDCVGNPVKTAPAQSKLFNRDGKPGKKSPEEVDEATARAAAAAIMNRASELRKQHPNMGQASAVIMAQKELAS